MSGTVMKFGPQWIRTLTDGAAPSSANSNSTTSSSSSTTTTANNNQNNNNNNSTNSHSSNNINSPSSIINNNNNSSSANSLSSMANNPNSNPFSSSSLNSNSNGGGVSKYKLAEYRYGREEMLALFEHDMEAPEDIKKYEGLFVEKAKIPISMLQLSDEEIKLNTRNWNSEAVLRSSGKTAAASAAAAAAAAGLGPGGLNSAGGLGANALSGMGSSLEDSDNRLARGAQGAVTAAGVLSSSPRGPPGSLSRIPLEQRGLLSLNSRGPTMRNLVNRGSNMYTRSQSHEDEGVDESAASGQAGGFDSRFGLAGQTRQPSSLRARFENSRPTGGAKPTDIRGANAIDGDVSREGRSVFDRLPNKYSVDDKITRKDVNGRPIQSNDWRSREWSGSGGADQRPSKTPAEERSWRSSRGGAAEDWRSNNSSNTSSSWYVRTDDQRNIRAGASQNQENLNSGFSGKRDTLRRPSVDDRQGDEEDEAQPRHRRDSLPEWSISDPLSGDKVGSFDASGAFREIAREDGSDPMGKEKNHQNQSGYDVKSSGGSTEQEWLIKAQYSSNSYSMPDSRNIDAVNSSTSLSELEKLSLLDRNAIPKRDEAENANSSSKSKGKPSDGRRDPQSGELQDRFSDANYQNAIHNQLSGNKVDLQTRISPSTNENEHKKSIDNSRNSVSPQSCQRSINQSLPANLQHMLKKQQQSNQNQNQQQSFLSAIAGSSNAMPPSHDEDGFAHLERAAEHMVAEWTADEEHEFSSSPAYFGNKLNPSKDQQQQQQQQQQHQLQHQHQHQQDVQANLLQQNNSEVRLSSQQAQQQTGPDPTSSMDSNSQKKLLLLPFNHEDSQQWFYRDTQGVIQGPFSAPEMFEWYKAGYFVKELLVRRACDELFYPLGEVIKMWDRIPFAPINGSPPPPITTQALLQFRAVSKQLELAAAINNPTQGQIPPNPFSLTHPGAVLLHGPILQQQQAQQVHQVLAAANLNQNISGPQEQQAGIRQILEATRQHDQSMLQQQQQQPRTNVLDQNEMQTQLRQLLAQLKNREGFSSLNAQEQQEVLVRQFVASRATTMPGAVMQDQDQAFLRARMMPFLPFFTSDQDRFRHQQRLEMERQKEEAEKQGRFIMEQRMKAEEEKQRIMDELQKRQRKQKEESEKQRQEAEKERLLKLSQLKQQQLAKQQEEFRQQMQNQQRLQQQQQEKKQQQQQQQQQHQQQQQQQQQQQLQQQQQQQVIQLNSIQKQQQQIERAKKAAQAQQVQQEQQRKTAWSTVSKGDQEPVSLATLQKMQEEEKEKERDRQRQIQQQIQTNQQQQQQLQQQLQRQMTWANAAQQSKAAPVKTLAEIQKEEEDRLAREKQKKTKVQPTVPNAGVWNNAASHLSWKNPPADS